jgi:hypothetical protein
LTTDNQPATVASGQKIPIISVTGVGGAQQASVTFQDVTTRLQVTPRVVEGGRILMAISVKDEVLLELVQSLQLVAPRVATRQAATQADIADGGTVVIAGLRQENFQNDEKGIPWLSKIPVLGWLFKNDLTESSRRELVVFLTAKIVASPGQAAVTPSAVPVAPGVPAPPGTSGQAPAVAPTTTGAAAPAALPEAPGAPAPPGPSGQAPAVAPTTGAAAPAALPGAPGVPVPSKPSGEAALTAPRPVPAVAQAVASAQPRPSADLTGER